MRLPFSSRKAQEPSDSSRRSSLNEDKDSEDPSSFRNATDVNSEAIGQTKSAPIDTPATSFSSYSSYNNREGKKAGMYKLSVVDNSGTFLPPSPPDTGKSKGSKAWSLHRKSNRSRERMSSFDGPFIISRESFEGYRRSFDIGHGGISPTLAASSSFVNSPRRSLDSSMSNQSLSISSRGESRLRVSSVPKVEESGADDAPFEDIKLEDDDRSSRRTILNRFGFGQRATVQRKHKDGEELQSLKTDN